LKRIEAHIVDFLDTVVLIGSGSTRVLGRLLHGLNTGKAFIVADKAVSRMARMVEASIKGAGLDTVYMEVEAGEGFKAVDSVVSLWEWMIENGVTRSDFLVAVGGGTLSDAAGFAAATILRGIRWCNIPTTLLGMADAAVGGKTGVDFHGKNMVGAFHHPTIVLCDTRFLETLPDRVYRMGFSEIVKHALLAGHSFYKWLRENARELRERSMDRVEEAVARSLKYKLGVVQRDYRELTGYRMVLNLGHTVAHALEKASGYTIPHGEAVAMGLVVELEASRMLLGLDEKIVAETGRLLNELGLPSTPPRDIDPGEALKNIVLDKKRRGGGLIVLPLLEALGRPRLINMPVEDAYRLLLDAWRRSLC